MATKPKATDFTGKQREALIKQNQEELARRSQEISTAIQVETDFVERAVIDADTGRPVNVDENGAIVEVEVGSLETEKTTVIRINEDLECTFGVGNNYSFKAGQRYTVPRALANHLDEKGYVWH